MAFNIKNYVQILENWIADLQVYITELNFLIKLIENGYEIGRKKHNNIILRFLGFEENYYIPLTDEKINWHKEQKEHFLNQFNDLLPERNTLKDKIESLLIENEYIIYDKRF